MRFILSSLIILSILSCGKESPVVTDPVISFTLTVTSGVGGSVSSPGGSYTEGKSTSITATPDSEYVFVNWSNGSTDNPLSVTVNSNQTITANFEKRKYPLTVSITGSGTVSEEIISAGKSTTEYNSGSIIRLTALPSDNWDFKGWSGSVSSTTNPLELTVDESKDIILTFRLSPPSFESMSPRYSSINETTGNFHNQYYTESYMTRETHENLFEYNPSTNEMFMIQEASTVYYDFDKNGSLDLFGFQYWSDGNSGEWGTRPGKYFLIKDYSWGNRDKIYFQTQVAFTGSTMDLADIDGDNQLDILSHSSNTHQNASSAYSSNLPELPVELIKIDINLNFTSEFIGPVITSHDIASGDIDNDGDNDILLWATNVDFYTYSDTSIFSPQVLINDGNGNFTQRSAFLDTSMIPTTCERSCPEEGILPFARIPGPTGYDLMDLNNDGHLDLISQGSLTVGGDGLFSYNENEYNVGGLIYYGDGTGYFEFDNSTILTPENPEGYRMEGLGQSYLDYDDDGDLDVFLVATRKEKGNFVSNGGIIDEGSNFYESYFLFVFQNNGTSFDDVTNQIFDKSKELTKTNFSHFYDITIRDVDNDGDYDLVPAKTSGWFTFPQLNNLYWENQGGFFTIREEGGYNYGSF